MSCYEVAVGAEAQEWIGRMHQAAETPLCLAHNGRLVGTLGMTDALRPEAPATVESLRRLGVERVVMLTGDTAESAAVVCRPASRLNVRGPQCG